MARAKSGTRIANLHISNDVKDSTWITNHYNGLLDTTNDTVVPLLDEAGLPLLDEAGVALQDDGVEIPYEAVATITPDAWNHITMVFDGTDLKLYIETVLTTTTATVGTIGTNVLDLTIG